MDSDKILKSSARPMTMVELARQQPQIGCGEVLPRAVDKSKRSIVVRVRGQGEEPKFTVRREGVSKGSKSDKSWTITFNEMDDIEFDMGPIPKRTLVPEKLLVDKNQNENAAYVSNGADRLFFPRSIASTSKRHLKRFSGKRIAALNNQNIFGNDDRKLLFETSHPWRCIGKIFWTDPSDGSLHWGTATLAGRNFIVTASHVIPWGQDYLRAPIKFVPAFFGSASLLGVGYDAWVESVAAWEHVSDDVCGYDLAICKLSQPLGDSLSYFGTKGYSSSWEDEPYWWTVGYPFDSPFNGNAATYQSGISVVDDDGDSYGTLELETYADMASGSSGGPLFAYWDGLPYVIGICSGNEDEFSYSFPFSFIENHNVFSGGSGLNKLVRWGRDNWG